MEFIGFWRPVSGSNSTALMRAIISSATFSVALPQASTTLLYFSPWVMRPSLYCCSYSFTKASVSPTIFTLLSGMTMSSLPNEMPARQAWAKPSCMMRSQKMTVSFWPQ
ncbi:hypothetical protein D3C80_1155280 [compost metagenome]